MNDLRYAYRLLIRQPGYSLLAILTIALGIGAATTLFSITYGVLLKPLPWPDSDRLVRLTETRQGATRIRPLTMTNSAYLPLGENPSTIEDVAAWTSRIVTLTGMGDADRIQVAPATASLFRLLRVRPLLGTTFESKDEARQAAPVAILSYGLWRERFGGDSNVIGRAIQFDGRAYTIVGVMRIGFEFPDRETRAWIPFYIPPVVADDGKGRYLSMFRAIGKLRPGATPEQAAAEATALARSGPDPGLVANAVFGTNGPAEVSVVPLLKALTADVRPAILVFLVAVGLLLAMATANVASLQLARATVRRRELAIRAAIGADRGQLTRQLLIENLLISLAGGFAGLTFSAALHRVLPSILPADFPRLHDIALDIRLVIFAIGIAVVTGVLFGLMPVAYARGQNLARSLSVDGLRAGRVRMFIMAGQVTLACVLLVGATLLARSFVAQVNADRGYDPSNLLTASLPTPSKTPQQRLQILETIVARLQSMPGAAHVAFTDTLPLTREAMSAFKMKSRRPPVGVDVAVNASRRIVSDDYFAALGRRIVEGRNFNGSDTAATPRVVIVNRTFVRRYLGELAVGERIPDFMSNAANAECEIVGVVDDIRDSRITDPVQPEVFALQRQLPADAAPVSFILLRTGGDPRKFIPALRDIVREQDSSLALESIMTMEDRVMTSLARPRLYAILLGAFAAFSLAITAVGLFGVLSYSVAHRAREIAVRTALGAAPHDVVRLVFSQGLAITLGGLCLGLCVSLALVEYLATFLYGVRPRDTFSFVTVPVVLLLISIAASVIPARRATRVDPMQILRAG